MAHQQAEIEPTTDAAALALIGAATFLETFADVLPGMNIVSHCASQHSARAYADLLDTGARAWLATLRNTGSAIGYAITADPDLPIATTPADLELKRIYLLSRFQGRGLGYALLETATDFAASAGASRLLLGVYENNHRAITFYKAAGFNVIGRRAFQVGQGTYDDLILGFDL
ncbi:MAG: GNAT family N-acetyltransferase [Pseudomonadota bacterium]